MTAPPRLILIGSGVMGHAILARLLRQRVFHRTRVVVIEHRQKIRAAVSRRDHVRAYKNVGEVMIGSNDVVILAIKPQDAVALLADLRGRLAKTTLVISIMAGISLATLREKLHHGKIIRAMPNIAATVGASMTAWTVSRACTPAQRRFAHKVFGAIGEEMFVSSDDLLDRITAVSGSGPAYVFETADVLYRAARRLGFAHAEADRLVRQTIIGSARLLENSPRPFDGWVARVASKRGTTEAALRVLRHHKLADLWHRAMQAAYRRARVLAKTKEI